MQMLQTNSHLTHNVLNTDGPIMVVYNSEYQSPGPFILNMYYS